MKKRVFAFATALILIVSLAVTPAQARGINAGLNLSFEKTTAICEATIVGNSGSDDIKATIKLWQGGTSLATWKDSGTGILEFSGRCAGLETGKSYKMTVDYTVNGKSYPQIDTSNICRG